jgi:predicted lipoprotein with Yx(FWY)xxD motif
MTVFKRISISILGLLLLCTVIACGSGGNGGGYGSTSTGNSSSPTTTGATATATGNSSGTCYRYCSGGTPTATTGSGSSIAIKTASVSVKGKTETVLTNQQGMTLYYRTTDTPSNVCSGGCASAWPPLISSSVPTTSASLPGKLGILSDANGSQVTYNGHPLYTFSGDSAPGQTNGEGLAGIWFVVPVNLPA